MLNRILLVIVMLTITSARHQAACDEPAKPENLKALVREYAFADKPKLRPDTEFKIEEYAIDGLKALDVRIILVRYLGPDGKQFNEALLICRGGKLAPLASTFGGHGFMSAVVSDGKLYYTRSSGSGRHRSHLGQLSIANGQVVIAESGPLLDQDVFVKKVGAAIQVETGDFERFNAWKSPGLVRTVAAKDAGFTLTDDGGKAIEKFEGKVVEQGKAGVR